MNKAFSDPKYKALVKYLHAQGYAQRELKGTDLLRFYTYFNINADMSHMLLGFLVGYGIRVVDDFKIFMHVYKSPAQTLAKAIKEKEYAQQMRDLFEKIYLKNQKQK
jgi:hypothetical protein